MYTSKMSHTAGQKSTYLGFKDVLYGLRSTKIRISNNWAKTLKLIKKKVLTIWPGKVYMTKQNNKVNLQRDCGYNS